MWSFEVHDVDVAQKMTGWEGRSKATIAAYRPPSPCLSFWARSTWYISKDHIFHIELIFKQNILFEIEKSGKNQIEKYHSSFLLKTVILLSNFPKKFERLLLSEKMFFSKIFLHFFIAFEPNNWNMLWPIGIFLFGRTVLWLGPP